MFGKRKNTSPAPRAAVADPRAGNGFLRADTSVASSGSVPAVALLCDAYIGFDGDDALRGFAASVLRSRSPQLELGPRAPVEAATGFSGTDDEARAELNRLLGRAMVRAAADLQRYELIFFTARSEVPPAMVWCLAPTEPAQAPIAAAVRESPGTHTTEQITARLKEIDAQLVSLRDQIGTAVNASSDAPGANLLIASVEEMLGRKAPTGTPTLGQVRALEHERDQLQAELAGMQRSP